MSIGERYPLRPDIQRARIELLTANIMHIVANYITDIDNDYGFKCRNHLLDELLAAKIEWSTETERKIAEARREFCSDTVAAPSGMW